MVLRDAHAAPHPARRALHTFRGVKKIVEGGAYPCDPASPPERAASLPSSPAPSRRASIDAPRSVTTPATPPHYPPIKTMFNIRNFPS